MEKSCIAEDWLHPIDLKENLLMCYTGLSEGFLKMNRFVLSLLIITILLINIARADTAEFGPARSQTETVRAYESLKYGMFICFGMNTFTGNDYDLGTSPSSTYAPEKLDVTQWIRVAKAAGMKYAVLTAKHMSGHCLWDSNDYDYDIGTSSNKTDVIAEFMSACKAEGIRPGIYYCILDPHNEGKVDSTAPVSQEYYNLIKKHLTEIHTRYPGITEQWLDIVAGKLNSAQRWELYGLIKKLNPGCLILNNQSFKDGTVVDPNIWPTDIINGERTPPPASGHNPIKHLSGVDYYLPMETCDTISQYWFSVPGDLPKSVRTLYQIYTNTVGRGANLLLNVPPDRTGQIPHQYVERLMELKKVIENPSLLSTPPMSYGCAIKASNVFKSRAEYNPSFAVDDDPTTRWVADAGVKSAWLELDLGKECRFNVVRIQEPHENRVKGFEVKYMSGDKWIVMTSGNYIGKNFQCITDPVTARYVRLEILESTINNPTKYNVTAMPDQNSIDEGPSISEMCLEYVLDAYPQRIGNRSRVF